MDYVLFLFGNLRSLYQGNMTQRKIHTLLTYLGTTYVLYGPCFGDAVVGRDQRSCGLCFGLRKPVINS